MIRVDRERRFEPDYCCDLTDRSDFQALNDYLFQFARIDVAWASSVCTDFTKWGLPESWACNRGGKKAPDLRLSLTCNKILHHQNVAYWGFENVAASRPFLTPIFGPVRAMVDGHAIWGNFPGLLPQTKGHKWKLSPSPDRAALRSKLPYAIGEAICAAVERRAEEAA